MSSLRIKILSIGKLKYSYLAQGVSDYMDRLSHHSQVEIIEIQNKKRVSPSQKKEHEGRLLVEKISQGDYVIAMERSGNLYSSTEWSKRLQSLMSRSQNRIAFLIGGELGLSDDLLERADELWSLSRLTFTHDMSRLLLVEQLYRAFTILSAQKYHK